MPFRFDGGSISCSIPVHAPISKTFKNDAGIVVDPDDPDHPKPFEPFPGVEANVGVNYGPASVAISPHYEVIPTITTQPSPDKQPRIYKIGWDISVSILGAVDTQTIILQEATLAPGEKRTLGGTLNTSFSMSVVVDDCFEETNAGQLDIIDAPFKAGGRIFQLLKLGSQGSATCGPASASGTVTTASEVVSSLSFSVAAHAINGASGAWSIEPPTGFYTPVDPVSPGGASDANGSASVSAFTLSLSATTEKTSRASVQTETRRPKTFELSGVVRAVESAYPDALMGSCSRFLGDTQTDMPIGGGAFSASYSQRRGSISGGYDGATSISLAGYSLDEFAPVGCSIKASSLLGVGDDPRAMRLLMRGRTFAGLSITKNAVTVDAGTTLTPTGAWAGNWEATGNGVAPTIAGGGISFSGAARRTFTHDVSFTGSRHLRLTVQASTANAAFALAIGGKTWNAKAGADTSQFTQIDVDLAGENSETATTSTADTKWPLEQHDEPTGSGGVNVVSDGLPLSEGVYFGVQRVGSLALSGAAGTTFVVSKIELVTKGAVTADWVPAFYNGKVVYKNGAPIGIDAGWPTQQYPDRTYGSGGTSTYFARRGPLFNADGVQMEQEDSVYQINTPPDDSEADPSLSPGQLSIADLVNHINRVNSSGTILNPGYVATSSKPYPASGCAIDLPNFDDCYMNEARPAAWLFGAGALASASGWTFGFSQPLGGVTAQQCYETFDWYPEASDFAGFGGANPTPMTQYLRAAGILRGSIHGLALSSSNQPAADKLVELRQGDPAPGVVVSSGTSGANGFYKASSGPFAKTVLAALAKSGKLSASLTAFGRKRQRVVFVVAGQAFYGPLAIDSPRQYLHVANGKQIQTYHLANALLAFESAEHAVEEWVRLCYENRQGAALFALGKTDENTHSLFLSRDQGRTLTEILSMTAKTIAATTDSERKWIICVYSDASDAVFSKVSKDGGASWSAGQSAGLTGEVLDLCQDGRAGLLVLTLRDTSADTVEVLKTRDAEGLNWTTLLP